MSATLEIVPSVLDRIRRTLVGLKMPRALEVLDQTMRQLERGEASALEVIDTLFAEEIDPAREPPRQDGASHGQALDHQDPRWLRLLVPAFARPQPRSRPCSARLHRSQRGDPLPRPTRNGKSHLATALGVEAVKAGRSVYFASLADIISALAKAEREGQLRERIRFLCRTSLLIVDDIGYLPVIPGGGNLFFQLVNARYERAAMILTSNRGFARSSIASSITAGSKPPRPDLPIARPLLATGVRVWMRRATPTRRRRSTDVMISTRPFVM
jgi:IstB-like ATP binding protein